MSIKFQIATKELVPEVSEMMRAFYSIDNYPFDADQCIKNLKRFMNDEKLGRLWVIIFDEKIVGYVVLTYGFSFEYNGRDAFIDELFLKEDFRSKGIGSATLKYLCAQAQKLDINAIHLEVERTNEKASLLYVKEGFEGNNRRLLTRVID